MGLYRFLRSVGFEHEDLVGGLLAEPPERRLNEQRTRLVSQIRQVHDRLIHHRRVLEKFRGSTSQTPNQQISDRLIVRLQRHERAYHNYLQLLGRLKQKLNHLRGKLVT